MYSTDDLLALMRNDISWVYKLDSAKFSKDNIRFLYRYCLGIRPHFWVTRGKMIEELISWYKKKQSEPDYEHMYFK